MIDYLEHHIVNHCNLKCAGCSHFSSIADEWYEEVGDFCADFTELAQKTNKQIRTIRLMGGEPLLHPQVELFLIQTRELFPDSDIQLVTNGLLINKLKDKLVPICNENKIRICISNYKILDIAKALNGFKFVRVDGKGQLYNISLDLKASQNKDFAFNHCDLHLHHWFYFQKGRFYPCCIAGNINIFNKKFDMIDYFSDDELSISIYDHSEEEIKEFLDKPLELCKYCNTIKRMRTLEPFHTSKGDIFEWICQ